jgi:hypothetical protein
MKYAIDIRLQCFDPQALREAALARAAEAGIDRESFERARNVAGDGVAFDLKALLVLTSPLAGCDLTVLPPYRLASLDEVRTPAPVEGATSLDNVDTADASSPATLRRSFVVGGRGGR